MAEWWVGGWLSGGCQDELEQLNMLLRQQLTDATARHDQVRQLW